MNAEVRRGYSVCQAEILCYAHVHAEVPPEQSAFGTHEIAADVAYYAHREDKTFSRFTEVLFRWALEEMKRNDITLAEMKSWHVVAPGSADRAASRASRRTPSP